MFKVGNKVDLERSRQVATTEGKELARSYDAKFIETSAGLKHNVDELLVGVLKQILLRQESSENPPQVKVYLNFRCLDGEMDMIKFFQLALSRTELQLLGNAQTCERNSVENVLRQGRREQVLRESPCSLDQSRLINDYSVNPL